MIIFGGGKSTKKRFNDSYSYDIKKNHFQLIQTVHTLLGF